MSDRPWVEVYAYPSNGKRYMRLQWGAGSAVLGYRHVPGGNVSSALVQARATELRRHLHQGASLDQLLRLIDGWKFRKCK